LPCNRPFVKVTFGRGGKREKGKGKREKVKEKIGFTLSPFPLTLFPISATKSILDSEVR
jgi:hypothetical protein